MFPFKLAPRSPLTKTGAIKHRKTGDGQDKRGRRSLLLALIGNECQQAAIWAAKPMGQDAIREIFQLRVRPSMGRAEIAAMHRMI